MQWPWKKAESDLDREVQYHIETLADAYERQGMSRPEALRRARVEFGGVESIKDACRDESVWDWLNQAALDVSFGWRMMRKSQSITIAAVLSLALGIGATTTILSLADTLLWRSLPLPAPQQLTEILWEAKKRPEGLVRGSSGSAFPEGPLMVADFFSRQSFDALRSGVKGKAELAGHFNSSLSSASFGGNVTVARLRGVTGNFFPMLQVQPFAGRLLADSDDNPAADMVVVVTHRFWRKQLGASLGVVGQTIRINNNAYALAGILPESFFGIVPGDDTDIYSPIHQSPPMQTPGSWYRKVTVEPTSWWMQLLMRRAPGVTAEELRPVLDAAFAASWPARPKSPEATPHIRVADSSRGLGSIRRRFGNPMWTLLALVALVLLVACANIANLLLARSVSREKEVALRVSLGCAKGRLMRQFFTESLMLACFGGTLSVGVAALLGSLIVTLMPAGNNGMNLQMEPDLRSFAATAIVTLVTAMLFGLYPAWRAARIDAAPALKEGSGSGGTASRSRWTPARLLVLVQVSLGVLLVSSAIIFTSHLNEIVRGETGFEREHVLLFDIRPGELHYEEDRLRQFYFDFEERLAAVRGVQVAGLSRTRPMLGGGYWDEVSLRGQTKQVQSAVHHGSVNFLAALGVPLIEGRSFTAQEVKTGAKVAVISEDLARSLGLTSPLGAIIKLDGERTVIGVTRTARYSRMGETPAVAYLPSDLKHQSATAVVRTAVPPMVVLNAIRAAVKDLDRDLPMVDIFTMEQQISRTLQRERMFAWLCGSFGVLALVLCSVGLYGLMSHTTERRTPEIGIRIALGASRGDVLGHVLWEGMRLAIAGLVLGVPLAVYGAHLAGAQKLLPEGPMPYPKLAGAIAVLLFSALAAVLAPALRASSVDPMRALRRG